MAIALSVLLTLLNWFAVRAFARINNLVTVLTIAVPAPPAQPVHRPRRFAPAAAGPA